MQYNIHYPHFLHFDLILHLIQIDKLQVNPENSDKIILNWSFFYHSIVSVIIFLSPNKF